MKKFLLSSIAFVALSLNMAQAVDMAFYKTLIDAQANPSSGQTMLYSLEYCSDGSMYLLSSYQTASSDEVGLHFSGNTYQGATAAKWGSKPGELKLANMKNSFLALTIKN